LLTDTFTHLPKAKHLWLVVGSPSLVGALCLRLNLRLRLRLCLCGSKVRLYSLLFDFLFLGLDSSVVPDYRLVSVKSLFKLLDHPDQLRLLLQLLFSVGMHFDYSRFLLVDLFALIRDDVCLLIEDFFLFGERVQMFVNLLFQVFNLPHSDFQTVSVAVRLSHLVLVQLDVLSLFARFIGQVFSQPQLYGQKLIYPLTLVDRVTSQIFIAHPHLFKLCLLDFLQSHILLLQPLDLLPVGIVYRDHQLLLCVELTLQLFVFGDQASVRLLHSLEVHLDNFFRCFERIKHCFNVVVL